MKLPHPFIRLPVRFDVDRLRAEIAALPAQAWNRHPADFAGNSSLRLISRNGLENDDVGGPMLSTPWLHACPYVRQLLSSFGVVWSRARLMRLAPGASVPEHADINLHWFRRVRVHVPVITNPAVRFSCGDETVHMQAGEAWLFDNWRLHRVDNDSAQARIHLVADTSGSASFWQWALRGASQDRAWPFDPGQDVSLTTERMPADAVLPPGEVDLLVQDLVGALAATDGADASDAIFGLSQLLPSFGADWSTRSDPCERVVFGVCLAPQAIVRLDAPAALATVDRLGVSSHLPSGATNFKGRSYATMDECSRGNRLHARRCYKRQCNYADPTKPRAVDGHQQHDHFRGNPRNSIVLE